MGVVVSRNLIDEICDRFELDGGISPVEVREVLVCLAEACADSLEDGDDFTIPGVCKFRFKYQPPRAKGARWKKGDERSSFGETTIAEADSPPVKGKVSMGISFIGDVNRIRPKNGTLNISTYLKTRAAKNVIRRKTSK
jgi:nucleoid DNA-binding protein